VRAALEQFYEQGLRLRRPQIILTRSLQEVNLSFDDGPRLPPPAALRWTSLFAPGWDLSDQVKAWRQKVSRVWDLPRTHSTVVTALWEQTLGLVSGPAPRWLYRARSGRGRRLEQLAGKVIEAGVWCAWLQHQQVVALMAPTALRVDRDGQLHSTVDAPAIEWSNGQRFYAVHGRSLPEHLMVEKPSLIGLRQSTLHQREALLEFLGYEWLLGQGESRLRDFDLEASGLPRRLVEVPMPFEPVVLVVVTCPSTGKTSMLRVPPHISSCRQAVAWTFGFEEPDDYTPWQQT